MKPDFKLTNAEMRLAELLWSYAPIASMQVIRLAEQEFGWKKSTTFSILRFLIDKGIAQNLQATVSMLYTREQFIAEQSSRFVDDTFDGSLPLFVAAFTRSRKLSQQQIDELQQLIDSYDASDQPASQPTTKQAGSRAVAQPSESTGD
ncbi:MAG: BlaI/MecI/CopY family transcriptional regulator [Coriobacteriia bacterium]|nr:BlaI/MecI/CopY family transcriptional regulator [Coriobacteriia bacterium]